MRRMGQLAIVCATVLMVACNMENRRTESNEPGAVGTAGVSAGDRDWVEDSMSAGRTEVELGNMAATRASNAEVKQFAEMMVRDHTKAGDELKQIAQRHSIAAPAELNDEHRDLMDRLSNVRGADFDKEYMQAMIDSHESIINHLQRRASEDRFGENKGTVKPERSDNPVEASLNQWAAMTLPTARHHLDEARRVNDSLGNRLTGTQRPATEGRPTGTEGRR